MLYVIALENSALCEKLFKAIDEKTLPAAGLITRKGYWNQGHSDVVLIETDLPSPMHVNIVLAPFIEANKIPFVTPNLIDPTKPIQDNRSPVFFIVRATDFAGHSSRPFIEWVESALKEKPSGGQNDAADKAVGQLAKAAAPDLTSAIPSDALTFNQMVGQEASITKARHIVASNHAMTTGDELTRRLVQMVPVRSIFISGLDGTGKSTFAMAIALEFKNQNVVAKDAPLRVVDAPGLITMSPVEFSPTISGAFKAAHDGVLVLERLTDLLSPAYGPIGMITLARIQTEVASTAGNPVVIATGENPQRLRKAGFTFMAMPTLQKYTPAELTQMIVGRLERAGLAFQSNAPRHLEILVKGFTDREAGEEKGLFGYPNGHLARRFSDELLLERQRHTAAGGSSEITADDVNELFLNDEQKRPRPKSRIRRRTPVH